MRVFSEDNHCRWLKRGGVTACEKQEAITALAPAFPWTSQAKAARLVLYLICRYSCCPKTSAIVSEEKFKAFSLYNMSATKAETNVDAISIKLRRIKQKPVPTLLTLFVDQDRPASQPGLPAVTRYSLEDCECTCEKALRRFDPDPSKYVVSDGIFALSIICCTRAALERAVDAYKAIYNLGPSTQTTSRRVNLREQICGFANKCEHRKIVERPHHFVPYPIIPRCRMDCDGVPIMEIDSDSDSGEEDEKLDEFVNSSCQALFPYNSTINNALIKKLCQKLPRSPAGPESEMEGHIYILKSVLMPDMVKIGVTTKDPDVRREQWHRCYPTIKLLAYTSRVVYAKLVESLIHTELLAQRYMEECSTCKDKKARPRSHTEWFRVTEELARQAVIRWAKWMGTRPYHTDTRMLSLTWHKRLQRFQERGYRPGVDHIPCKEKTWQDFTDMRRPTGTRDGSGAIKLITHNNGMSPFSD